MRSFFIALPLNCKPRVWQTAVATAAIFALAAPSAFGGAIKVVDVIPTVYSSETGQNAEPSIAVNPNNPNEVLISSFASGTTSNNPYYLSTDGGTNWNVDFTIPHGDTSLTWANNDAYLTALTSGGIMAQASTDPTAMGGGFNTINSFPAVARPDQPWAVANSPAPGGSDNLYVGYNNTGGSSAVAVLQNAAGAGPPAWKNVALPNSGGVPVRIAANGNTAYAAYEQYTGTAANRVDNTGNVRVVRTTNAGTDNFGAAGSGGNALTAPATGITIPFGALNNAGNPQGTMLGLQRLGSDLSIAVSPTNANLVYVAYAQVSGGNSQIVVKASTDGGTTWGSGGTNAITVVGPAALPALAVAQNGTVGLLYTSLNGGNLTTSLAQLSPTLQAMQVSDLSIFPNGNPAKSNVSNNYIGDYQDMVAVGNNFYGTFSASNDPTLSDFPQGVYYDRYFVNNGNNLTGQLTENSTIDATATSIDPFFFTTSALSAVPTPGALAVGAVGLGLLLARRRMRATTRAMV